MSMSVMANSLLNSKNLVVATDNFVYRGNGLVGVNQLNPSSTLDIRGGFLYTGDLVVEGETTTESILNLRLFYARGSGRDDHVSRFFGVHQTEHDNYLNNDGTLPDARGVKLYVLSTTGNLISQQNYKIQEVEDPSDTAAAALQSALAAVTKDQFGVLLSYWSFHDDLPAGLMREAYDSGLYKFSRFRGEFTRRPYAAIFQGSSGHPNLQATEVLHGRGAAYPHAEIGGWFIQDAFVSTTIPGPFLPDVSEMLHDRIMLIADEDEEFSLGDSNTHDGYKLTVPDTIGIYEEVSGEGARITFESPTSNRQSYIAHYSDGGPGYDGTYIWVGVGDNWDSNATDQDLRVRWFHYVTPNVTLTAYRFDGDGQGYARLTLHATGADYAEWFEFEEIIPSGSLVGLNLDTGFARQYRSGDAYLGPISSNAGFVGNRPIDIEGNPDGHVMVALIGQVAIDLNAVRVTNRLVYTLDDVYIGVLLANGLVLIGK